MKTRDLRFIILLYFLFGSVYGQNNLKVDAVFSNQMVLQRNQKIPVWGTANSNVEVQLKFNGKTVTTTTNTNGCWNVSFNAFEAGGPYTLKVASGKDSIQFNNILIGDIWLASGQSNMHLDLKRTLNGKDVAKRANNPNIRIYNMKPTYPTGKDGVHTLEELDNIQNNQYFKTNGWVEVTPENVLYFSAVAYYFSEKLQGSLNVPIGIIHNAVPGSPIESWISKEIIEQDSILNSFVKQRWVDKENEADAMISVAKNQISQAKKANQKHPWMPTYNYVNGILPIKKNPLKGIIWYQGESNAEQPELYKNMFKKMVELWRSDFNQELPFYYVQLTSREGRPAWPEFRNAQRELLDMVPNTKMVVISDVGDRNDTHAKNKKPVGERLALLALGDAYKIGSDFESPMFDKITRSRRHYYIHFKGQFSTLELSHGKKVFGFEISNDNINFEKFVPKIQRELVKFKTPKQYKLPIYIRYAWKPYTEANLISGNDLPVSTFRTKIEQ